MTKLTCTPTVFLLTITFMLYAGCTPNAQAATSVFPASDPSNTGNWILRKDISDEFEGTEIDK